MATATVYGIAGLQNFAKAQDLALQGVDFSPALRQCSVAIRGDALENFQSSSSPDGTAWPALSALTVATRRQGSSKPLLDRGILAASVTARGTNNYESLTPHSLEVGSNLIYARLQQEGGTITPKTGAALAVPLNPGARRIGSPRGATGLFRAGHSLATMKGKRLVPMFALLSSVTIPAREFLGFGQRLQSKIDNILGDFVERYQSR